ACNRAPCRSHRYSFALRSPSMKPHVLTSVVSLLLATTAAPDVASAGQQPSLPGVGAVEALDGAAKADALLGQWWTEGKEGRVKIVKTSKGLYEVILVDGKDVDKKDEKNPNPKLRERKLRGI